MGFGKFACPECGNEETKNNGNMCTKCHGTNFKFKYDSIVKKWLPNCSKCGSTSEDHVEVEKKNCSKCDTIMIYKIQDNLPNLSPRVNDPTSDKFWKKGLTQQQQAAKILEDN